MFEGAVFLDVGAHSGQTLDEVLKPGYGFHRIYAFEPMPVQANYISEHYLKDERLRVCHYGLSDQTGSVLIYGSNDRCEASMYARKRDVNPNHVTVCQMVEASEWFRDNLEGDECVLMKFNCEGAEVPILNNLMDSGEIWKVSHMVITFDCRYIAGEERHEQELKDRLATIGYDRWVSSDDAYAPHTQPHTEKIAQWLHSVA